VAAHELPVADFEDLSAYVDGELPAERAAQIEQFVARSPLWRRAHSEMLSLSAAMDGVPAPAAADSGLAGRIIAGVAAHELPVADYADLSAYVDGELPAERAAQIEQLIAGNPLWRRAHSEMLSLSAAMDGLPAPAAADSGLAGRIIAAVAGSRLSAAQHEELSAYADGELSAERSAEIEQLIAEQPAWRLAYADMQAVDQALDNFAVPGGAEGLADRVLARVSRESRRATVLRVLAWAIPAAAAAAVVLVVVAALSQGGKVRPVGPVIAVVPAVELEKSKAYQSVPQAERPKLDEVIIDHLSFFRDYEVAEDFETLQAIEKLEKQGT
jgi:anti-sigma factor RsiW